MKKFIATLALIIISAPLLSQNYIKTNALYTALLMPNVSFETRLGPNFTFNTDAVVSVWKSVNGRPYMFGMLIPEVRYFPKQAFNGFYVGLYTAVDRYKLSKWGHPKTDIQYGWGFNLGASVGYELPISERWMIDFYLGGGWHLGHYYGFDLLTQDYYVRWNGSGEWMPYKVGVTFSFKL